MSRQPAFTKIIKTDYLAFLSFIFAVGPWGIYLLIILTEGSKSDVSALVGFTLSVAVIPVVALGGLLWRVGLIKAVFRNGEEREAMITRSFFQRGQGHVDYAFQYQGQEYESSDFVVSSANTRTMQPGRQVTVVVDRRNPKRAFIRDLYSRV